MTNVATVNSGKNGQTTSNKPGCAELPTSQIITPVKEDNSVIIPKVVS